MWKKYCTDGQTTDDNIVRCVRIACRIPKATKTHSEFVILIAPPQQQLLHEGASGLRDSYIACLQCFNEYKYWDHSVFRYDAVYVGINVWNSSRSLLSPFSHSLSYTEDEDNGIDLTFKNRASYIQDGRTASLQMLHFIYFFNKYKYWVF
jgi:hypothetical protein